MVVTLLKDREHCSRAICYYPPMMDKEIIHATLHGFSKFLVFYLGVATGWITVIACITDAGNGCLVKTVDICLLPTSRFKTKRSVIHDRTWRQSPSALGGWSNSVTRQWRTAQLVRLQTAQLFLSKFGPETILRPLRFVQSVKQHFSKLVIRNKGIQKRLEKTASQWEDRIFGSDMVWVYPPGLFSVSSSKVWQLTSTQHSRLLNPIPSQYTRSIKDLLSSSR